MSKLATAAKNRLAATIRFARATHNGNLRSETDKTAAFHEAQAEGVTVFDTLRAQILLNVASNNSELVTDWLSSIDFGDYYDNYQAYIISRYQIENGEIERSRERLHLLREHIIKRPEEVKSVTHILPRVDETIAQADRIAYLRSLAAET